MWMCVIAMVKRIHSAGFSIDGNLSETPLYISALRKLCLFSIAVFLSMVFVVSNNVDAFAVQNAAPIKPQLLNVKISQTLSKTTLVFPWSEPVGNVVFIRNNKLWIIFDKKIDLDFEYLSSNQVSETGLKHALINKIEQHKSLNNGATIISADYIKANADNVTINTYKNNHSWVIELSKGNSKMQALNIASNIAGPDVQVEVPTQDRHSILRYLDPFIGDEIVTIPVYKPRFGIETSYEFIDFEVFKTFQGIAIGKLADNLQFDIALDALIIKSRTNLNISPKIYLESDKGSDHEVIKLAIFDGSNGIVNLKQFVRSDENFNKEILMLQSALMDAPIVNKPPLRTQLAMIYLANGLGLEALAMLKIAKEENGSLNGNYIFSFLESLALFATGDNEAAYKESSAIDIATVPLHNREELRFWNTITKIASVHDGGVLIANAINSYNNMANNFLINYPDKLLIKFGLTLLSKAIDLKYFTESSGLINKMLKSELSGRDKNRLNSLTAKFYSTQQDGLETAVKYWDMCLSDVMDNFNYVRCSFDKDSYLYKNQIIDDKELIKRLDVLHLLWKGGDLGVQILKTLGDLKLKNDDTAGALRAWKVITDDYPNTAESLKLINVMSKVFIDFFITNNDKNLSPLQAAAFFYEFSDLMPIGSVGDDIILRLVGYLSNLELLDKAIPLLHHQVTNRLIGDKMEEGINQLADLYIKNEEPAEALKVIRNISNSSSSLPISLKRYRTRLEAKALYKLGKTNEAILILKDDFTQPSDDIKADILWKQKDFKGFSDYSEPYIYSIRYNKNIRLKEDDVKRLVKQAIAYIKMKRLDLLNEMYLDFKSRLPKDSRYSKQLYLLVQEFIQEDDDITTQIPIKDASKQEQLISSLFDTMS